MVQVPYADTPHSPRLNCPSTINSNTLSALYALPCCPLCKWDVDMRTWWEECLYITFRPVDQWRCQGTYIPIYVLKHIKELKFLCTPDFQIFPLTILQSLLCYSKNWMVLPQYLYYIFKWCKFWLLHCTGIFSSVTISWLLLF